MGLLPRVLGVSAMSIGKGSTVVVTKLMRSDSGVRGNDVGVVLTTSKHFLNVRLERTGKIHPFFVDQLRVL